MVSYRAITEFDFGPLVKFSSLLRSESRRKLAPVQSSEEPSIPPIGQFLLRCPSLQALDLYEENTPFDLRSSNNWLNNVIPKLCNLTTLILRNNNGVVNDDAIATLLKRLEIRNAPFVTDVGISGLTNLATLSIGCHHSLLKRVNTISNAGIKGLTNLRNLDFGSGVSADDDGVTRLTNLTKLRLEIAWNRASDAAVRSLSNLTDLQVTHVATYARNEEYVLKDLTNEAFRDLTKLTTLCLRFCKKVSDSGLVSLINLTSLALYYCPQVKNAFVASQSRLTSLNLARNPIITDDGISGLANLTVLDLATNFAITDGGVRGLTNLTELNLCMCKKVSDDGIIIDCDY
jgi:hypothetical protein